MALGDVILMKLTKKYEPSSFVHLTVRGNDIAIQTDKEGNPVVAFIGKLTEAGKIKGKRYVRTLKADRLGRIIKDHWDLKGKAG